MSKEVIRTFAVIKTKGNSFDHFKKKIIVRSHKEAGNYEMAIFTKL